MATGLPVIATAVGGNPELVQDDVNGRLVPISSPEALTSEMGRYVRSAELRRRHGTASRQRAVSEFSVEAMVDSYVRLYDSLCPAPR
jgi:glycosyltransferase involved in cell wall biosynthesis